MHLYNKCTDLSDLIDFTQPLELIINSNWTLFQTKQANDLSVIKDALAFKLQTGLPNQELSPDIWEH